MQLSWGSEPKPELLVVEIRIHWFNDESQAAADSEKSKANFKLFNFS